LGCRSVIGRKEARLQLSDPVIEFYEYERSSTRRTLLARTLRKSVIIEESELPRLSAEHSNKREQRGYSVEEKSERSHEFQQVLSLQFEMVERVAHGEKKGAETPAGMRAKGRIAVFPGQLKRATRRINPFSEWSRPRGHKYGKEVINSCPQVIQSATLEQIAADLSDTIGCIMVAKPGVRDHPQRLVAPRHDIIVAVLQSESDHLTN